MKYQIGEKIGEIARVYHSFREHDTLAKRIEGRFVSNPFEVDVLTVFIDQVERAIDKNITITFSKLSEVVKGVHSPKENFLYDNSVFLNYITSASRDLVSNPNFTDRSLAKMVKEFDDKVYEQLHSSLPKVVSEEDATFIVREFYKWHITPSEVAGQLAIENDKEVVQNEDPHFKKEFIIISSTLDSVKRRLLNTHPYASVDRQILDMFRHINPKHLGDNYLSQKQFKKEVITNLYSAAYLLHYIAHFQVMQANHKYNGISRNTPQSSRKPPVNLSLIDEILRQALKNSQNKTTKQSITPSTIS